MAESTLVFPESTLRVFATRVFQAAGLTPEDAARVADNLIHANLRGVDTHGLTRLPIYVKRLRLGAMNPRPRISVLAEGPATLLLNGDNGPGAVVATHAMQQAIRKAREIGTCWVGVRRGNHFGTCAYYTMMASDADMVGIVFTNGPASMAPWGGRQPYLSTNPISFAIPSDEGAVVLDMATSVAARGHFLLAMKEGRELPPGLALDREGRPTTDPRAAWEGLIMPLGGHKGYGLSLVFDLLAGVLNGAANGPRVGRTYEEFDRPSDVGHTFVALDVSRFMPPLTFRQLVGQTCREIRAIPRAPGVERIYVPGEIEAERAAQRARDGIPLPASVVEELRATAAELGVPWEC